jgi:uroporphyrinogen-III synthase
MRSLLITRPRRQSEAFAAAVDARLPGRFRAVISPLLAIVPRPVTLDLEGVGALAFTSANAVEAFAEQSAERGLPAYCVGDSTAAAARAAGMEARSADGDASALAALIARERPGPLLHLRGAFVAAELAPLVPGTEVRSLVIYDQVGAEPGAEADALLRAGRLDAAALFSPRSAGRFASLARARGWRLAGTTVLAISAAAEAALGDLATGHRVVAPAPSREGVLRVLGDI